MPPLTRRFPSRRPRKADPDAASDPAKLHAAALTLLARRDYATGELRQKLEHNGYDKTLVTGLIEEMAANGYLNDARYAQNYVTWHADRGEGPRRIEADLKAMSIAPDLIQAALDAGPDWKARAKEVRSRRFGPAEPETWPQKAKQGRFLQYRGFSSDHIRAALNDDLGPDFEPGSD